MNRFATLWTVECEFHREGRNQITTFEVLNTTAPKDANVSCSSFEITFWDKAGNTKLEVCRCHCTDRSASPEMWFVDGIWWEMSGGEVRHLNGKWMIVKTGWKNSRLAKMLNKGEPAYRS